MDNSELFQSIEVNILTFTSYLNFNIGAEITFKIG